MRIESAIERLLPGQLVPAFPRITRESYGVALSVRLPFRQMLLVDLRMR